MTDLHYGTVMEFVLANRHDNAAAWLFVAASSPVDTFDDIASDSALQRRLLYIPVTQRISATLQRMMHQILQHAKLSVSSADCCAVSAGRQQNRQCEGYMLYGIDITLCSILLVLRCQLLSSHSCNTLGFSQTDFMTALAWATWRLAGNLKMLNDQGQSDQPGYMSNSLVAGSARLVAQTLQSQDGLNMKLERPAGTLWIMHAIIDGLAALRPLWQQIAADEIANAGQCFVKVLRLDLAAMSATFKAQKGAQML